MSPYYFSGKKDFLITEDPFYSELGTNEVERRRNYQRLVIDNEISNRYNEKIWGTGYQKYHENRKLKYNLRKY